ncbi:FAD-binding protein [Glarea lozoyensis ATCC 20868]|uniref:FAD-binding protein n=1 Tax=Glarea lozoyensis (strain ATCC 20868 / MF5171) TaxID=1116229 RepID=S3DF95_GLAL2|nr:FAD-binding protein [Glarea lozoyensis ATCC 20868]EPE25298.1 FAD-binding protein [Glarea lozoyensis ATCC 20868]
MMFHWLALAVLSISLKVTAATPTWLNQVQKLDLSEKTKIYLPSDASYVNQTIQRYTTFQAPTYKVSIKPALAGDVQKIVKFAASHNVPFLATGGGHGFSTTLRALHGGIEIDLGFFKNISVDPKASTMVVGGAVLNGDVIQPLYAAGKELQTGSDACVGLVGTTLGGGVGRYNGLHGMLLDALQSVELVTASGDLVTASKKENVDLFWGIRGAGMNFGIVVEATYLVPDLTNNGKVMNADFLFPVNESTAVFEYFKSLEETLPAELSLILQVGYNINFGGTYIVVNAVYAGLMSDGLPLIQPLIDANPSMKSISVVTYNNLISSAFFGTAPKSGICTKGLNRSVYGVGIKTFHIPTFIEYFQNLQHLYSEYPAAQSSVFFIESFPKQAVVAVPNDATAYPHRGTNAHLLFNYGTTDPAIQTKIDDFGKQARNNFSATSGFDGLQVYVSYGHGDEGPIPLYSERNLPRLRKIKQQWDPEGLFNFNQPLGKKYRQVSRRPNMMSIVRVAESDSGLGLVPSRSSICVPSPQ